MSEIISTLLSDPLFDIDKLKAAAKKAEGAPLNMTELSYKLAEAKFHLFSSLDNLVNIERPKRPRVLMLSMGQQPLIQEMRAMYPEIDFYSVNPLVSEEDDALLDRENSIFDSPDLLYRLEHQPCSFDLILDVNFCKFTTMQWQLFEVLVYALKPEGRLVVNIVQPLFAHLHKSQRSLLSTEGVKALLLSASTGLEIEIVGHNEDPPYAINLHKLKDRRLRIEFRQFEARHSEKMRLRGIFYGKRLSKEVSGLMNRVTVAARISDVEG